MDVGFIGMGRMGRAMAANLARAGHTVRAWNRSPEAARGLDGVTPVASAAEAFAGTPWSPCWPTTRPSRP